MSPNLLVHAAGVQDAVTTSSAPKKVKRRDPNAPRRPLNAYALFTIRHRNEVLLQGCITGSASTAWALLASNQNSMQAQDAAESPCLSF